MSDKKSRDEEIYEDQLVVTSPSDFDSEDFEETIEIKLPTFSNLKKEPQTEDKKLISFEKQLNSLSKKLKEVSTEQEEVFQRISLSLGDSKLALKNSKKSLKEVQKFKEQNEADINLFQSKLEEISNQIKNIAPSENKSNLTVQELTERVLFLEDLPEKTEKRHEEIFDSIEILSENLYDIKENIDEVIGRADTALEVSNKLKGQIENFDNIKEQVKTLKVNLKKEFEKLINKNQKSVIKRVDSIEEALKGASHNFKNEILALKEQYIDKDYIEKTKKEFTSIIEKIKEGSQLDTKKTINYIKVHDKKLKILSSNIKAIQDKNKKDIEKISNRIDSNENKLNKFELTFKEKIKDFSIKTVKASKDLRGFQDKIRLEIDGLIKLQESNKSYDILTDEINKKINDSILTNTELRNSINTLKNNIIQTQNSLKGEIENQLNPLQERVNAISCDLSVKLSPVRKEVEKLKSFIEEEMITVKNSWEKLNKTISDSKGAMEIAKEAKTSLEALDYEINSALSKINDLMSSIKENSFRVDSNSDKIDLTVKLVDETRDRIKSFQETAPYISISGEESLLNMKDIMEDPDMSDMDFELDDLLSVMIEHKASDLHLKEGAPPTVRLDGELVPVGNNALTVKDCKKLVLSAMKPPLRKQLSLRKEVDFAYSTNEARFRVNAFLQKQSISAAFRLLWTDIPSIEELNLPPIIKRMCDFNNGLILVTGPSGSGKSTTLASMINYINRVKKYHIITVEDPIEFIHKDNLSIITQREVGADTESFSLALKQALRQDPNVILIGEMRDPETIMTSAIAAETGHLVLSTLHTPNTVQAINRVIDVFSGDTQNQFRLLLANTLRGIISQRLLTRADGGGRIPSVEVMIATPTVNSLILEEKTNDIYDLISQGDIEGMQTFTQSLVSLCQKNLITKEEAMLHADHPTELRMILEGHISSADGSGQDENLMSWL